MHVGTGHSDIARAATGPFRHCDCFSAAGTGRACHVIGQYDGDTRKNKRVAREMQEMTDYINKVRLVNIKELDEDRVNISCVTCHAGSGRTRNTMAVPLAAAVPRN